MRNSVLVCVLVVITAGPLRAQQNDNSQGSSPDAVRGTGTAQYLPKFTGSHTVANSALFENGPSLITYDNFSAANVTGTVNGPLSVALTGVNNTPDGETGYDAFYASGLIGVLGQSISPASAAVEGMAYSQTGDPVGVFGKTVSSDRGIGVRGQAVAATGAGIGVLGEALSSNGQAGLFNHMATTGNPTALFGFVSSTDAGEGVHGRSLSAAGTGIGVIGDTNSTQGFGGSFANFGGGGILRGANSAGTVFRVDGNGTVYANGGFQPSGADFAESMAVSGDRKEYVAGDLLEIDQTADRKLALSHEPYSTLVAGIYSTKPGVLGSTGTVENGAPRDEVPLAMVGIVPCKVTSENGSIRPGDLLVSSSIPGHAMKGTDRSRMMGRGCRKGLGTAGTWHGNDSGSGDSAVAYESLSEGSHLTSGSFEHFARRAAQ